MSQPVSYPRVAALKTAPQFLARLAELGVALPFDEQVASGDGAPLAQPTEAGGLAPATASASCRWRAGTARRTAVRPI